MGASVPAVDWLAGETEGPSSHRLAGMPAPVWTMLLWLLLLVVLGPLSRVLPVANELPTAPRYLTTLLSVVGIITILILRARTPRWFLHALVIGMIVVMVLFVVRATNSTSVTPPMLMTMVVAAYTSYWMPTRVALVYVGSSSLGVLVAEIINPSAGGTYVAWFIVTSLSLAVVLLLGSLIAELKRQAVTDPLTGLLNRSGLALLTSLKPGAGRQTLPRTLVVVDLDGFKLINDEQGHLAGDAVLREFAATLVEAARADDVLARSGGDEFLLVLPGTDLDGAEALVSRLRGAVKTPFSHGVVEWDANEAFDVAMAQADQAMYAHKARNARPIACRPPCASSQDH